MLLLEKSLQLRLSRATELYTLLGPTHYHPESKQDSLPELLALLQQIKEIDQACETLNEDFLALAYQRMDAFKKNIEWVKQVHHSLKFRARVPAQLTIKLNTINELYSKLYKHNLLPPPKSLFKKNRDREIIYHEKSHLLFVENYCSFVKALDEIKLELDCLPQQLKCLWSHYQAMNDLNIQVQIKQQSALDLHQYRLNLYRELKARVLAVVNRTRHLFGSGNDIYLAAYKYNIQ